MAPFGRGNLNLEFFDVPFPDRRQPVVVDHRPVLVERLSAKSVARPYRLLRTGCSPGGDWRCLCPAGAFTDDVGISLTLAGMAGIYSLLPVVFFNDLWRWASALSTSVPTWTIVPLIAAPGHIIKD